MHLGTVCMICKGALRGHETDAVRQNLRAQNAKCSYREGLKLHEPKISHLLLYSESFQGSRLCIWEISAAQGALVDPKNHT